MKKDAVSHITNGESGRSIKRLNGGVFFAGANSARGFVSYYDTILNDKKIERLYILKGGPGTGKSSQKTNKTYRRIFKMCSMCKISDMLFRKKREEEAAKKKAIVVTVVCASIAAVIGACVAAAIIISKKREENIVKVVFAKVKSKFVKPAAEECEDIDCEEAIVEEVAAEEVVAEDVTFEEAEVEVEVVESAE